MGLSNDLLSQFAKITKDEKQTKKETTVYGTTVENNGKTYVKIDGSDLLTPASTTINTKNGERVTVMLKNHTATITGNVSSPSARLIDINEINEETISELNTILANKADVANLNVEKARIDTLVTDNATIKEKLTASEAEIDSLQSSNLNVTERLTANETAISTLEQTADSFEVRLDTTDSNVAIAQSTANAANTNATNAAETATNFLSYDSTNGLLVGNKTSGSWSGTRAQIKSDSFNVLDQNGTTLASYGTTTTLGYGGYNNKIGSTNIYGNSISLVSNGDINVEASWIRCHSIAPNDHATYALGVYGEKGWSNIYLGKGDNKTNALHIISGSSTYLLCGVNSSGQYVFGNNAAVMYYQAKDVGTDNTGNAFKITSGNNTASNNTNSVWLFGGADATSRYIGSYMAYSRTYSSAANMVVTADGLFGRSTSSSERYKNSIVEADISELKGLYNLPIKKFKYNADYISSDDELYDKYLYGFIVEDLEDILPCAVEHITDENGNALPEMWNSNIIIPSLLKLIQDLNNRVITLEKKGE